MYELKKSYYSNRSNFYHAIGQFLTVRCSFSSLNIVGIGLAQGSVFRPLLFLMFMIDLKKYWEAVHSILFGDSNTVIITL